MSQNTDNLVLTKQDANENFSRSILNANWDIIDAEAGARNQGAAWTSSSLTLSAFIADCQTKVGTRVGFFTLGMINYAPAAAIGLPGAAYITAIRQNSSYMRIYAHSLTTAQISSIGYVGGTWETGWSNLALSSQIANLIKTEKHSSSEISVNAGGVGYTTVDMTKTGYTLIGIVGIDGSGTSGMAYSDWYLADSVNVRIYYKNNSSRDKTNVTLKVTGLYIKT